MAQDIKNNDSKSEFVCKEDPRPLIEEGEYQTRVIKIEQHQYMRKEKRLYLHHQLVSPEKYRGLVLFQSINASYESYGIGTKFYQEWKKANHDDAPKKFQKMDLNVFQNKTFLSRIRTVKSNNTDNYSVVSVIIKVVSPTKNCRKDFNSGDG